MRKWLVKVVEGRYRCWDDFLQYGMLSAGHGDPPSDPLKLLTARDEVYAFLNTRGYVGRGQVTSAAVVAAEFVVSGNFVSMDGSMKSRSEPLDRSVMFTRRTATVTMSAPEASWAWAMTMFDGYLPVPTMRRDRNVRPAMTNGESIMDEVGGGYGWSGA